MQQTNTFTLPREMKQFVLLVLITTPLSVTSLAPANASSKSMYNITDYGAIGDSVTLNTKSIQAAIDDCARKGGGTIHFPAGTFLSGTLYLENNIRIDLEPGAVLLGSRNIEDYPLNECRYPSGSDRYVARALVWGEDLENITITGRGTIDGQGSYLAPLQVEMEFAEV
jgi:polygalacturonase